MRQVGRPESPRAVRRTCGGESPTAKGSLATKPHRSMGRDIAVAMTRCCMSNLPVPLARRPARRCYRRLFALNAPSGCALGVSLVLDHAGRLAPQGHEGSRVDGYRARLERLGQLALERDDQ